MFVLLGFAFPAHARTFVWKDPVYNIKVTFPENWMRQANLDDDMRLNILAPQGSDHAACKLYVSHDGRYMDAYAADQQAISVFIFDQEAIKREIYQRPDTNMVGLASYSPGTLMGKIPAVTAEVDYQKAFAGSVYPMHAMVLASQYNGDRIVMSCEATASGWPRWQELMQNIIRSVDIPSAYAASPNGLYRRFQDDGQVYFTTPRNADGTPLRSNQPCGC